MGSRPEVIITGAGVSCALGDGIEALRTALRRGEDGLRPVTRFDVSAFDARLAGLCPGAAQPSATELGIRAAKEAWTNARLDDAGVAPERIAVIVGTCFGEDFHGFGELAVGIARAIGAKGPAFAVPTACSSSTSAIGLGRDLIEEGAADVVLAGGADVITREVFAGFHALGALSAERCAPFGEPAGTTLGEGAGFVVLERTPRVPPLGWVLGYAVSADAHHETAPEPSGQGVARAIAGALDHAGLGPQAIDLVSAHGTGTRANDPAEVIALGTALGEVALRVPVTATKSFVGHTQGAAGVIELCAALLCATEGTIPPTLRAHPPRPGAPADPVAGTRPRQAEVNTILKLSAAFGGANAALVVGRSAPAVRPLPERRPVFVRGLAAIGPHGLDVPALEAQALGTGRAPLDGKVAPFDLCRIVRSAPPRGVDPSGRMVAAAAALALADGKLAVRGALRERVGLFTGTTRMPAQSVHDCEASIAARGITGVAALPFSHMVPNAPAGTATRFLSLKGPLLVVAAAEASGLLAIARAGEYLATRRSAEAIVAGGHDELPVEEGDGEATAEGAALALLSSEPGAINAPRLIGWSVARPGALGAAVKRAMNGIPEVDGVYAVVPDLEALRRAIDPSRLPLGCVDVRELIGGAVSAASAFAFVLAAAAIRRHAARRLLVVADSDAVSCAVVIGEEPHGR